ncbi:MAG: hypothetical protein RIF41_21160, partial [Polyangiaceae bacterium]
MGASAPAATAAPTVPEPLPAGALQRFGSWRDRVGDGARELRYLADGRLFSSDVAFESFWEDGRFESSPVLSMRSLDDGRLVLSTSATTGLIAPSGRAWVELSTPVTLWRLNKPPMALANSHAHAGAWIDGGRELAYLDRRIRRVIGWKPTRGTKRDLLSYEGSAYSVSGATRGKAVA